MSFGVLQVGGVLQAEVVTPDFTKPKNIIEFSSKASRD